MPGNITPIDLALSKAALFKDLLIATQLVRNWYDLLLFRSGMRNRVTIVLKSGKRYQISNDKEYFDFMNGSTAWALERARRYGDLIRIGRNVIRVKALGRTISLHYDSPTSLGNTVNLAIQQLLNQEYAFLKVKDKDVIDVGASIGDTAICFALKGARHVYAFEPIPKAYETARKNVRLNHLKGKITLLNKAIGRTRRFVNLSKKTDVSRNASVKDALSKHGKRVVVETLENVVKEYGIDGGILKVDCEGDEYGILLGTPDSVLSRFDQVLVEYHYGYIDLREKLRSCGFEVKHTWPKYGGYYVKKNPTMYFGLLFAEKK